MDDTFGFELFNKLLNACKSLDLDVVDVRSQSYDNSFNIK